MSLAIIANHTLAFVLELILVAAIGMWAYQLLAGPVLNWVLAIIGAGVAISLWGYFAAPKSANRLGMPRLLYFKLAMFAAGVAAFLAIGMLDWAIGFGALATLHLAAATWLRVL